MNLKHTLYKGQNIFHNGMPPPQPWDINVQPTALFQTHKQYIEIPNTAHVEVIKLEQNNIKSK
jgi:hypothetical protein